MTAKRKRRGRFAAAALAALLALCLCAQAAAEKVITLTFTGDCVIGSEERSHRQEDSFDNAVKKHGYDYFFANFKDLFGTDDCTVINLQGVLADTNSGAVSSRSSRYRGQEEYVRILQAGSVEAVSLCNNHAMDYSGRGLTNTQRVLEEAGIGWTRERDFWIFEKDGIRIAFVSIDYGAYQRSGTEIRAALQEMQKNHEISATVFLVHEGREFLPVHQSKQEQYGEYAVEQAGAELVVMHQAHVMQGIRILDNRCIFYSLGNFVYGGDSMVRKGKDCDTLYTMAVQTRLYFTEGGTYKGQQTVLYPAYSSGTDPQNNYRPRRLTAEEAEAVMAAVQADTDFELPAIRTDENGLAYVLMDFLADETPETENTGGGPEAAAPRPNRNNR